MTANNNVRFEDWAAEQMRDPKFRAAVEELEPQYQAERLLVMFSDILRFECDDDGTYIVGDNVTVAYGDGETPLEALRDYIVTLIEYTQLVLKSQSVEKKLAIKSFVDRVCKLAESNMECTGKLEGAHYNAMQTVLAEAE